MCPSDVYLFICLFTLVIRFIRTRKAIHVILAKFWIVCSTVRMFNRPDLVDYITRIFTTVL